MAVTQAHRLLSPEEIAVQSGQQVPYVRVPERASVFADRETRLRERAAAHPMRDFLLFMAEVAHAQHDTLRDYGSVALPDPAALDAAARAAAPPVPVATWRRDPRWRAELRRLLDRLAPRVTHGPAQAAIQALRAMPDEHLETQADRLLNGVTVGLDLATAPLVAAGLQTYWTHLAIAIQDAATRDAAQGSRTAPFGRTADARLCPCCGSLPTASVTRIGADAAGYRYLHCSLCSMQWHMVRIKCAHCEGTKGIHYQSLRPLADDTPAPARAGDAVEVETCDTCGHYLKIVHMERDPNVEPVADDLASVTLDLLVSDAGLQRHGVNLLLLFGDPDAVDPGAT